MPSPKHPVTAASQRQINETSVRAVIDDRRKKGRPSAARVRAIGLLGRRKN